MKENINCSGNYDYFKRFLDDLEKRNISNWDEMNQSERYLFKMFALKLKQDADEALAFIKQWEDVCGVIEDQMTFQ